MYRYDDAAEAHADLANHLRQIHSDGNHLEPLLQHLNGPAESRREEVEGMPLKDMRNAAEKYERWVAVSLMSSFRTEVL